MSRRVRWWVLVSVALLLLVSCQRVVDRTPDSFSFVPVTGVEPGSVVTSNGVTVSGVDVAVPLSVSGGDAVALVNGEETAAGSSVVAGDVVAVRLTASDSFSTTVVAEVSIGGVSAEFSVTTRDPDVVVTPDPFSFEPVVGAELATPVVSEAVTVSGVDVAVPASVSGDASAALIVNGEDVAGEVDVVAGDEVAVRLTSSGEYGTSVAAVVTIGGGTADFVVTTKAAPVAPGIVSFAAEPGDVLWGDEDVVLAWSVTGDVSSLVLSSDDGADDVVVTGLTESVVRVPSNVPSVTYTLTAASAELGVSVSEDVVVGVELWVCNDPSAVVTIADAELESALRLMAAAIPEVGPITCADMQALTAFSSGHFLVDGGPHVLGGIESLAGLQHAINLTELDVQVNLVRDLTPLATLPALEVLVLDLNPVADVAPLAGLTTLQTLSLWFMQERDVDAFPYATNDYDPATCGLAGIADLSPIRDLVNLTHVYMSYNAVSDLSPLEDMTELELIFAVCNNLTSLAPLANKGQLAVLWAQSNAVGDSGIAGFGTLTSLQWLRLDYNRVSDVSPLAALENLYAIDLEGNFLEGVAALADNLAFPTVPGTLPDGAPSEPTLGLGYNCLDTSPGSPADQQVETIEARGVTVVSFDPAVQRDSGECALFEPSSFGMLRIQPQDRPFGRTDR